ncbi:MAG: DNA mismatch repair protein MutS [Bacteroidetes bacterium GWF2_41_31]|nr:MAG: DNA mismatch repair protein MutS [Bacteroidetes bacterium GWF2_41_31]
MKQFYQIKAKYPDALLLFRVGDFYETFGADAIRTSAILGIVLTKRRNGAASFVELAGFPYHSLDTYLPKLVRAGHRVAICDQLEDPKLTKTIVKRGVTELVTPGVTLNDNVLEQKENNFLAAVHLTTGNLGVSFVDISTGEFFLAEGSIEYVDKLLQGFAPSEVVIQRQFRDQFQQQFGNGYCQAYFDDWVFSDDFAQTVLLKHFHTTSLKGFGVESLDKGIVAAGACIHYLLETHHDKIDHISKLSRIDEGRYVWLDKFTVRNLELIAPLSPGAITLLDVIDHTASPMGARMMRRWITLPLKDLKAINDRLNVVDFLLKNPDFEKQLHGEIAQTGDLERLISKVATGRVNPRELIQLKRALQAVERLRKLCKSIGNESLSPIADQINPCQILIEKLSSQLTEEPPAVLSKGNVIASGVSSELDELRNLAFSGKDYLKNLVKQETERTGISSLKIGFNNVFGYYLEVTNTHKDKVPPEWHRKQTLTSGERYITEELKEYEQKILGAEEKMEVLEQKYFEALVHFTSGFVDRVQLDANLIAGLDCLDSFARISVDNNYSRPDLNEELAIDIKGGRHPVIEKNLPPGESYIANDVFLDHAKQQIIMITGPNMSGKSALLRQTALIVLLAQMGCFVPADSAKLGIVDKLFTRVGASDNISSGESTFMVEMNETASILNNISNRSLILLDEIGRGTSTYDGISIAWSIAEYLHNHPAYRAKVLFATHYHELNEMSTTLSRIKNYHVTVKEMGNRVIFLRKLKKGGSEHSFGIHVAEMAGMPRKVLERARQMLTILEKNHSSEALNQAIKKTSNPDHMQLSFIQLDDPLLLQIKADILNTNIDVLTPVEALMKLNEIKKLLGSGQK